MRKLVNSIIKRLKGQDYSLDTRIPMSYLLPLMFSRLMMAVRGAMSRVKHEGFLFIAGHVTIKARSMFQAGRTVSIGKGCFIDALSIEGVVFGDNVSMGKYVRIECTGNLQLLGKGMKVGNNVGLGADTFFGCTGGIYIDDNTILGNFVSFHSENHLYDDLDIPIRLQGSSQQGITVGKNCWIGAKATILDGTVIEDGCIIAAGAVVTAGTYRSNEVYGGVPARFIKSRKQFLEEEQRNF